MVIQITEDLAISVLLHQEFGPNFVHIANLDFPKIR